MNFALSLPGFEDYKPTTTLPDRHRPDGLIPSPQHSQFGLGSLVGRYYEH